ncbi:MAG: formylglycine-generating enzyme family protein [bacterium]|nr:formylglycine-generating enzyme family protein [bacterium]
MMRVIRRACTGRSFDAGTEHDVSRRRAAAQPTDDPVPVELSNWAEAVGVAGHDVVRLAREWHRALPPEVWAEEVLAIGVDAGCPDWLVDGELETAKNLLRRVSVNLRRGKEAGDVLFESLASWLQDFGPRRTRVWLDPELGPLLRTSLESIGHEAEARQTLQPAPVRKGEGGLPTTLVSAAQAYQFGDRVEFCGVGSPSSRRGSWLASLRVGSKIGFGASRGAPFASEQPDLSTVFSSPLPHGRRMVWRSDLEELVVELLPRPDWARAMGRDRFGLWAEFAVEEVVQRMRYIPPGRFLMGSPEAEAGRRDDEGPAHEVQLTSGFWLGETLCTQALWEVVTKDNPSEFRSPNRPVERVSCADIEGVFLKKLADRGFEGRLPTEAEWEYACRGFVDAATYRGDLEISDGVAAPQLESIAWYGANCGTDFDLDNGQQLEWLDAPYDKIIGGTHPVAGKDPNPLGLFDMLGNVWEWCSDGKRDYAPGWVIDPEGPLEGASRVVRGGSWNNTARSVRAAIRYSYGPGSRVGNLGFRLARGQESAPSQGGGAGSHDRVRRDAGEVAGEGGVNQGV